MYKQANSPLLDLDFTDVLPDNKYCTNRLCTISFNSKLIRSIIQFEFKEN